jgi:hypothetical protein
LGQTFTDFYNQAEALKKTAETMISTGNSGAVEETTRVVAQALLNRAHELFPQNTIVLAMTIRNGITWSEILTVAASLGAA